jgi:hypothetical protein
MSQKIRICSFVYFLGGMPYNCRSCTAPLRLDRGSSRCIKCCQSSSDLDCCHCDAKRHTKNPANPLTADAEGMFLYRVCTVLVTKKFVVNNKFLMLAIFAGECHFVSRRVSESEEKEISSGKWNDSMVLSGFWFCVFLLAIIATVVLTKRRKRIENYNQEYNGESFTSSRGLRKHTNAKYTPVNLTNSESSDVLDLEDSDDQDQEVDFEDQSLLSEGVPLVMKT